MKLSTIASVRRLARLWVDLSDNRRKKLLGGLDTDSRIQVIENMVRIRKERNLRKNV